MKLRALALMVVILVGAAVGAWFRDRKPFSAALRPSKLPAATVDLSMIESLCRLPLFAMSPAPGPASEVIRPPLLPRITVDRPVSAGMPMRRTPPRTIPPEQAFIATAALPAAPPPVPVPETTGLAELDGVLGMLRDYRTRMGENPVGSNAEIMRAVMGGNPVNANLGPPAGQTLNDAGELIDPWGSPFFFHQVSAKSMEIRSAGPDRKLWSTDDLTSH